MQKSVLAKIQRKSEKSSLFLLLCELKDNKIFQTSMQQISFLKTSFAEIGPTFNLKMTSKNLVQNRLDGNQTNNLYNYRKSAVMKICDKLCY